MSAIKVKYWLLSGLAGGTALSGAVLSAPFIYAEENAVDSISVSVPISCSLTSSNTETINVSLERGEYRSDISASTLTAYCNDINGYSLYAVGYTLDTYGNTTLAGSSSNIATGTATSGDTSNWAMKLSPVSGTYTPTISEGFDSYHAVPESYTKVASFTSYTDVPSGESSGIGSSVTTSYAVYASSGQTGGKYTGKVKYILVHPSSSVPDTE